MLLFIDGNHENFERLYQYPIKEWHIGRAHEIRPHVLHLMRGQVFEIDGKKIFTFGGMSSHDITGGILDMNNPNFIKIKKMLDRSYEPYRINHLTWWKQTAQRECYKPVWIKKSKTMTIFIGRYICAKKILA